jgi:hypothetical protein
MTNDEEIQYSHIRFDYYLAGRHLFFHAHTKAAKILLGYAVECQLKMALLLKAFRPQRGDLIARLDRGAEAYWRHASFPLYFSDAARLAACTPARDYVYPTQFTVTDALGKSFVGGSISSEIPYKTRPDMRS